MTEKKNISDFAIFGGEPAFQEVLHVGRPNIPDRVRLLERFNDILDRRWLTNLGPYVKEFERKIAEFLGVKHCVAMCNGTVALEIAIRALGMQGEVILPSFTFVATAHALQRQEITPIFCDIDPATHNIDPRCVEKLITPRTTGIIGVHLWGRPCDIDALDDIARRHNLKLLYDAAHAFSCSFQGKMIGNFGDAEVMSFHATKFMNTFEGGAVVTNDDELAQKMRLMKNFGFVGLDKVIHLGTNGKMNEMSAAMGVTSLENVDTFIEVNRQNFLTYRNCLANIPGIRQALYDEREKANYQYVILEVNEREAGISRDQLVKILHPENILARRYFYPGCHRMEPYKSFFPNAGLLLPQTEKLSESILCLPTGTAVDSEVIEEICHIIRLIVENGSEIQKMFATEI